MEIPLPIAGFFEVAAAWMADTVAGVCTWPCFEAQLLLLIASAICIEWQPQ